MNSNLKVLNTKYSKPTFKQYLDFDKQIRDFNEEQKKKDESSKRKSWPPWRWAINGIMIGLAVFTAVASVFTGGATAGVSAGLFAKSVAFMSSTGFQFALASLDTVINATADIINKESKTTIALDFLPLVFFGLSKGVSVAKSKYWSSINKLVSENTNLGFVSKLNKTGKVVINSTLDRKATLIVLEKQFSKDIVNTISKGKMLTTKQMLEIVAKSGDNINALLSKTPAELIDLLGKDFLPKIQDQVSKLKLSVDAIKNEFAKLDKWEEAVKIITSKVQLINKPSALVRAVAKSEILKATRNILKSARRINANVKTLFETPKRLVTKAFDIPKKYLATKYVNKIPISQATINTKSFKIGSEVVKIGDRVFTRDEAIKFITMQIRKKGLIRFYLWDPQTNKGLAQRLLRSNDLTSVSNIIDTTAKQTASLTKKLGKDIANVMQFQSEFLRENLAGYIPVWSGWVDGIRILKQPQRFFVQKLLESNTVNQKQYLELFPDSNIEEYKQWRLPVNKFSYRNDETYFEELKRSIELTKDKYKDIENLDSNVVQVVQFFFDPAVTHHDGSKGRTPELTGKRFIEAILPTALVNKLQDIIDNAGSVGRFYLDFVKPIVEKQGRQYQDALVKGIILESELVRGSFLRQSTKKEIDDLLNYQKNLNNSAEADKVKSAIDNRILTTFMSVFSPLRQILYYKTLANFYIYRIKIAKEQGFKGLWNIATNSKKLQRASIKQAFSFIFGSEKSLGSFIGKLLTSSWYNAKNPNKQKSGLVRVTTNYAFSLSSGLRQGKSARQTLRRTKILAKPSRYKIRVNVAK